jgi:hypothetical protein
MHHHQVKKKKKWEKERTFSLCWLIYKEIHIAKVPKVTPPPPIKSETSSEASTPKTPVVEGPPRTVKTDEVYIKSTGSVPRNKTIELMYASVGFGSGAGK